MKKTLFIKNAVIMTASSLILRFLGMCFKVRAAALLGDKGIGLYGVIFSVYIFASSFAQAGLCTAVTRLCAEAEERNEDSTPVFKKCMLLSCFVGVVAGIIMLFSADFTAKHWLGVESAGICLKIICISLPFLGMSSALRGYFLARRNASPCAVSQIFEQTVRIFLSMYLLKKFAPLGIVSGCIALTIGDVAAEIVCCIYLVLRRFAEIKKDKLSLHKTGDGYPQILRIAFPLTCGKYGGALFRTAENVLVPKTLSKMSGTASGGLSFFGNIKGMALPVLLFPGSFLNSVSSLLLPEISASRSAGRKYVLKSLCEQILKLTLLFSIYFACLFSEVGAPLGRLLYNSDKVAFLLTILAPLVPLMYLDCVSDGILKGLDCQKFCFRVGIIDSFLRVVAVILFLPHYGMRAFLVIMYASNILTAFLNTKQMKIKSGAEIDPFKWVFLPLILCIGISRLSVFFLTKNIKGDLVYIILYTVITSVLYFASLFIFKILTGDDIHAIIKNG